MQTYPTGYAESHRIAEQIFREILPRHGMAVREEQIALCHEILDTLYNKEISLCEAGVGIGKTLAYLVACVLWQMNRPDRLKLPVVISTSSVVLQDAIINDYLPNLSAILLEEGIIQVPLTAVIRKGKERFVCDARLAERASLVQPSRKRQRNSLHIAENILDIDHIPELSRYDRCRICVPQSCPRDCFLREDCRYQQYLRDSMKPDIQICNHNYLLADASHRQEDRPLLLRSYQALVVDEAHKLPDAARQMYTETLSQHNMDELCFLLQQAHYKDFARQMRTAFLTLSFSCTQGLSKLRGKASEPFVLTPFRRAALIDCIALLQNAGGLPDVPRYLLNRLGEAESLLRLFLLEVPTRILYIDYDADGQPTFCAASSRVPQLLRSALWNTREPAILTSGTLAAAGDFSHTEQLLGLAAYRPLRHFRANSPFNYKKKCLLYFPPRVKMRMDNRKMAEEIVRLVGACHGHALVLFTSYRQMAEVRALTDGQWQYPTYQAWRNGGKIIQKFKESGNGVLFAAGSCWEGIDFSGDMVSLLIIARLPFPIPDPVSDYERQKYPNLQEYIAAEITPEMQKKLRQGFGRAIRTEQDSCVVAILDERAAPGAKYHNAALAALPDCQTTSKIEDAIFLRLVMQYAEREYGIDNDTQTLAVKGTRSRPVDCLHPEEVEALFKVLPRCSTLEQVIVMGLLNTGMRRGELAGLTWEDIDFDHCTVHVDKSLLIVNKGYHLTTTKEDNVRDIDVAPEFMEYLKTYRDQWLAQKQRMGSAWQTCMDGKWESYRESLQKLRGKNFIVINDFGWPISPDHYGKIVDRVAEKAGIRKIHPHMFRHTFVSILLSNPDIGVATVAAEAGHAQPSTTLAIYTQVYHKRQDSIRSQMSETLYKRKTPER